MNVIWDDEVSLPDSKVDDWAKTVVKNGFHEVRAGTGQMINAIRLEVYRGNIKHTDVTFHFKDKIMYINKDGRLDHWPDGFSDKFDKQLEELLGFLGPAKN